MFQDAGLLYSKQSKKAVISCEEVSRLAYTLHVSQPVYCLILLAMMRNVYTNVHVLLIYSKEKMHVMPCNTVCGIMYVVSSLCWCSISHVSGVNKSDDSGINDPELLEDIAEERSLLCKIYHHSIRIQ